jgi:hypothetical protein
VPRAHVGEGLRKTARPRPYLPARIPGIPTRNPAWEKATDDVQRSCDEQ